MKIINRIFYLNVDGMHPNDVPGYVKTVRDSLLTDTSDKINRLKEEGRWEDFFIPVRESENDFGLLEKFYGFLFGKPKTKIVILEVNV